MPVLFLRIKKSIYFLSVEDLKVDLAKWMEKARAGDAIRAGGITLLAQRFDVNAKFVEEGGLHKTNVATKNEVSLQ